MRRGGVGRAVATALSQQDGERRVRPVSPAAGYPRVLLILASAFVVSTYLGAIRISDFSLAENPENLAGVLLAVTFALLRFGRFRFWAGPSKFFLVYFGVTALLTFARYAMDRQGEGVRVYAQYAQAFLLYLIFFDLCRDWRAARAIGSTFLVTTILLSLVANLGLGGVVGATAVGRGGVAERVGVLGMNLNDQAFLYAAALIVLLCRGIARWPRFTGLDWALVAGGASMLLALLHTGSRGGLLTLVAGVATALVVLFRGRRWAAYVLLVPGVLYAIGSAIMSSDVVRVRVEATLAGEDFGARDVLAREAFQMLKERPLTGWGTTYVDELGARMGRLRIAAHNTYLQVASAFGLVGFVPWLLGLVATGLRLWRHRSSLWGASLLALFAALLVAMVTIHFGYGRFAWIFLALAGAMPLARPQVAPQARRTAAATGVPARGRPGGRPVPLGGAARFPR